MKKFYSLLCTLQTKLHKHVPVYSRWNPAAETLISELKLRYRLLEVLFRSGGMVVPKNWKTGKEGWRSSILKANNLSYLLQRKQQRPFKPTFTLCERFSKDEEGNHFNLRHLFHLKSLFKRCLDLRRKARGSSKKKESTALLKLNWPYTMTLKYTNYLNLKGYMPNFTLQLMDNLVFGWTVTIIAAS